MYLTLKCHYAMGEINSCLKAIDQVESNYMSYSRSISTNNANIANAIIGTALSISRANPIYPLTSSLKLLTWACLSGNLIVLNVNATLSIISHDIRTVIDVTANQKLALLQ